ncbi:EAL domain-containing protein [Chelativorans sp. AA-79]|uniref:putative bifunctional diguanylate cyclase/phosphodiesterase n=1 Tax=Chelativorans sp. AA-79 TaxID=3028735 RepID=UPI0023FA435B|nr:EAL domain-containing protein [Chelativorans sp. AA-79]WEX11957.1 EAL domain-containing protein [Chelativorans sp. AA-79]
MPISVALSSLILIVQVLSGDTFSAAIWFLVVNGINGARIVLALSRPEEGNANFEGGLKSVSRRLRLYSILALLSGFAWSFLAVLTNGYAMPQSSLHLIILAGISAGAVTYGNSYAKLSINFITPPLLILAGCLLARGSFENYILTFAVLLFLGGLVRGSLIGQARFREASRLKHEAEQAAMEMERISREDHLTGLLNRRGLEHAIERLQKTDGPFVAMLIDLDGFKSVNDTYGHKVGDELLVSIAYRIKGKAPAKATLARIGGDEFVLLFSLGAQSVSPAALASAIISSIAEPYPGAGSVQIGASMGIYQSAQPELTRMLSRADVALYAAKRRGRNEYCFFDSHLERELERRQSIERDLRSAIEAGDLRPWFQPIINIETEIVIGFEALLRWSHPVHGAISPPEIVAAARETGTLHLLTETVFAGCCALIDGLAASGRREIRVAMNVSPRELDAGHIDDMILDGLKARGLPAAMFEIEITEEAPVDRERADEKLGRLSHAGISIALDDFGTGFSTLASLKDRRISKVKIDKEFVCGLAESREDQLLVKAVIDVGRALGIDVVAEGVERKADQQLLRALGCKTAQGFLFSKAIPAEQAVGFATIRDCSEPLLLSRG